MKLFNPHSILYKPLSFEVFFVLFLFAGRYKADPRFSWIKVDLTALFFCITVLAALYILLKKRFVFSKPGLIYTLSMLGFVLWVILSYLWTPGQIYATKKCFYIATLTLWASMAPALIIGPDIYRLQRFYTAIGLFGIWTALESIFFILNSGGGFINTFGANYLAFGYTLSLTGLVFLGYLFFNTQKLSQKVISIIIVSLIFCLMLAGGGKGPFLAFICTIIIISICLLLMRILRRRSSIKRKWSGSIIALTATLLIIIFAIDTDQYFTTVNRIGFVLTEEGVDRDFNKRIGFYREAWRQWKISPIVGNGIGSYPLNSGVGDERFYPHNLFLEILSELGLVGLILLLLMFTISIRQKYKMFNVSNGFVIVAFSFVLFAFLAAQFSGDISDNRQLFMAFGLLSSAAFINNSKTHKSTN